MDCLESFSPYLFPMVYLPTYGITVMEIMVIAQKNEPSVGSRVYPGRSGVPWSVLSLGTPAGVPGAIC